jgi:predicted dehydrogenase
VYDFVIHKMMRRAICKGRFCCHCNRHWQTAPLEKEWRPCICQTGVGESSRAVFLNWELGTLSVTSDRVVQQAAGAGQPTVLEIPDAHRRPEGEELFQFAWNRLIADFVQATRTGDANLTSYPNLPSLADGLHTQQVIAAAMRAQKEQRWVAINEFAS